MNDLYRTAALGRLDDIEESIAAGDPCPPPETVELLLIDAIGDAVDDYNRDNNTRKQVPKRLSPAIIAEALVRLNHVVRIKLCDGDDDGVMPLAVYRDEGPREGCYDISEGALNMLIRRYNYTAPGREVDEVRRILNDGLAPVRTLNADRDLVAVNNGIFNYETKELMDFNSELVFMSKSQVDYVDTPDNPHIQNPDDGTDWDVESWMAELGAGDPEITHLLWQVLGACIRPHVEWNKAIYPYNVTGNNGKGTYCALARNLCGSGGWVSVSMNRFGERFLPLKLLSVSACIVDENDVGKFLDEMSAYKAVVTGDAMTFERKYRDSISTIVRVLMIQCVNDVPRFKDRTGSMYRRTLPIPFNAEFERRERKYIKSDYLSRPEVLRYVLWRVLKGMPDYYELDVPAASKKLLGEFEAESNPVLGFLLDVLPRFEWKAVSNEALYEAYRHWIKDNNPQGREMTKTKFCREVGNLLRRKRDEPPFDEWIKPEKTIWVGDSLKSEDPVIRELDYYTYERLSRPSVIRGICHRSFAATSGDFDGEKTTND